MEDLCLDDAHLQPRRGPGGLRAPAPPGRATAEPRGARRRLAGLLVQHRRELRDEHQLAGLRRRIDHELSHADARADRPELHVGGVGHGRRGRADPRIRAPLGRDDRQLLGRSHPDHALHSLAALVSLRAGSRFPGRRADVRPIREGRRRAAHRVRRAGDRQGRQAGSRREGPGEDEEIHVDRAGHRGGAGSVADRDQAARDERRRLLQRELGASVREPDAALELPRAPGDSADLGRALLHLRRHGR